MSIFFGIVLGVWIRAKSVAIILINRNLLVENCKTQLQNHYHFLFNFFLFICFFKWPYFDFNYFKTKNKAKKIKYLHDLKLASLLSLRIIF
jgi:hypothetical protein